MRHKAKKYQDSGVAAVELALLIPVFVLLIAGILEFGAAFYLQNVITSASREGARYGIVYRSVTVGEVTTRLSPLNFNPSIKDVIDNYLIKFLKPGSWTVPAPTLTIGTGTTIPDAGNELTVQVTAPYTWVLLKGLVPGMEDVTISATTTMKLE
jgi:hypothetical protein